MAQAYTAPNPGPDARINPGNPYAAPEVRIGDYVNRSHAPNYRYSDSSARDDGYVDNPSEDYAPHLTPGADGTPDARRMQRIPLYQYRAPADAPPENWWNGPRGPGQESVARHKSQETVDGDGWTMVRGVNYETLHRSAPDPRRTPPAESRVTAQMAPTTYSYTRPFNQDTEKYLNGNHFSMADHRRNYEIYGMAPINTRRNTYRSDPLPWDTNIVDTVPTYQPVDARITQVEVADAAGRAWRL